MNLEKNRIPSTMGRNYYDKAFKEYAVKLSYQCATLSFLSKEIVVSADLISKWRNEFLEYGSSRFQGCGIYTFKRSKLRFQ